MQQEAQQLGDTENVIQYKYVPRKTAHPRIVPHSQTEPRISRLKTRQKTCEC
jgi:hypothetical protein